ncbi:hypothetical protein AB0C96_12955 [Streptomyces sp. NPDC048506]
MTPCCRSTPTAEDELRVLLRYFTAAAPALRAATAETKGLAEG